MTPAQPPWHVLHVRPRCEKKMAEYCAANAMEPYLPLRQETKIYQRRKVTVEKPVFPGYVFAAFAPADRELALKSNLIVRILPVADQLQLRRELDQVQLALSVDPTLGGCEAFTAGRSVRITAGPFMGLEGIVQTVRGQAKVVLNVEMIGRAVAVEVETNMLEPAE